jgi:hypothetical protein
MIRAHLWGHPQLRDSPGHHRWQWVINAKLQKVTSAACGCRNRECFKNAILFHLGGLKLYPALVSATYLMPNAPCKIRNLHPWLVAATNRSAFRLLLTARSSPTAAHSTT